MDPADEGWPHVSDGDSVRRQVTLLRRRTQRLGWAYIFLAICLAIVEVATLLYLNEVQQSRAERYCTLAQQAVDASTPDTPVSPALTAGAEAVGCELRVPSGK